jgi:hypothetical protein
MKPRCLSCWTKLREGEECCRTCHKTRAEAKAEYRGERPKFEPPVPPVVGPSIVRFGTPGERMAEQDDPGRRQLAERGPILGNNLDATGDQSPPQLPGGSRQVARVRRSESLAFDPLRFPLEDGFPMLPAFGGQAVGSLRTRNGFHDPGFDQLMIGGQIPLAGWPAASRLRCGGGAWRRQIRTASQSAWRYPPAAWYRQGRDGGRRPFRSL